MVERKEVESSNVKSVGYDEEKKILTVEFKSGGTYEYAGVPKETYDDLMEAPSKGRFVAQSVKGQFEFKKV